MRRSVQGLFARRLFTSASSAITTSAATTKAVRMLSSTTGWDGRRVAGLYGAMALLMGGGDYVCHDCRRRGDEERRRRRIAGPKRQKRAVHTTKPRDMDLGGMEERLEGGMATERPRMETTKNAIQHWTELAAAEVPALLRLQQEALSGTEGGMLDDERLRNEIGIWRLLLNFSKRVNPDTNIRRIWNDMRRRGVDIPAENENTDAIWRIYVSSALGDKEFMDSIISYALDLSNRTGGRQQWPHLYDTIIFHHLLHSTPETVEHYHRRLYPRFQPVSWASLFQRATRHNLSHPSLRKLHSLLNSPGLYETIITTLTGSTKPDFRAALAWHHHLLRHQDHPPDSSPADALIRLTARFGAFSDIHTLISSFAEYAIPFTESSAVSVVTARLDPSEALEIIFETVLRPREILRDAFWSSIFKTNLRPARTFHLLSTAARGCTVSDETLVQVSRTLRIRPRQAMAHLRKLGLNVELADPSNRADSPPAMALQEQLLAPYMQNHHLRQLLRKILPSPHSLNTDLAPHLHAALSYLQLLRDDRTPLDHTTMLLLPRALLNPRRRAHAPSEKRHLFPPGKDLTFTTSLHLQLCHEGYSIPQSTWRELFIRYGKTGRLDELEDLFRQIVGLYRVRGVGQKSGGNPLKVILDRDVVRACVEWGFVWGRKEWGLKVVREIAAWGGWVDGRTVKRGVRTQVAGMREVDVVKRIRGEVEEAWGEKLWEEDEPVDEVIDGEAGEQRTGEEELEALVDWEELPVEDEEWSHEQKP